MHREKYLKEKEMKQKEKFNELDVMENRLKTRELKVLATEREIQKHLRKVNEEKTDIKDAKDELFQEYDFLVFFSIKFHQLNKSLF